MTSAAKKLLQQALTLSDEEREDLVVALSDSLPAVVVSTEWTEEIQQRIAALKDGSAELVSGEEVARQISASLDD